MTVKAKEISENNVAPKSAFKGKTDEELRAIVKSLESQYKEHQVMAIKVQGAIEAILQMLPEGKNHDSE